MKIVISALLLFAPHAWAIKYYQSSGGSIKEIDAATFSSCSIVIYRNSSKSELTVDQQKNLVRATLKGELINDPGAASMKLKSQDGACSYADNSEAFK